MCKKLFGMRLHALISSSLLSYDLIDESTQKYVHPLGVGAYHTGVELWGLGSQFFCIAVMIFDVLHQNILSEAMQ